MCISVSILKKFFKMSWIPNISEIKEIFTFTLFVTIRLIFVQEIHYNPQSEPLFVSINLQDFPKAQTNASRFRVWQPSHGGLMNHIWAIDSFYIGGSSMIPNVLYEDFNGKAPLNDAWIDYPAGRIGHLCNRWSWR